MDDRIQPCPDTQDLEGRSGRDLVPEVEGWQCTEHAQAGEGLARLRSLAATPGWARMRVGANEIPPP